MNTWAVIDSTGKVVNVILATSEHIATLDDGYSYLLASDRLVAVGGHYIADLDVFVIPQPFASWSLNESRTEWLPPTPKPSDATHTWTTLLGMEITQPLWEWNEADVEWQRTDGL